LKNKDGGVKNTRAERQSLTYAKVSLRGGETRGFLCNARLTSNCKPEKIGETPRVAMIAQIERLHYNVRFIPFAGLGRFTLARVNGRREGSWRKLNRFVADGIQDSDYRADL
jgi:hypothetical protein